VGVVVCGEELKRIFLGKNKEDVLYKLEPEVEIDFFSPLLIDIKRDLALYLAGKRIDFPSYPLKMDISPIAQKVLYEVRKIPYGEVRSYGWVAQKLKMRGYRAVGRILSINPFPIIIPCHRVIRTDGSLGGFSSGIELKRKLLELEGISI